MHSSIQMKTFDKLKIFVWKKCRFLLAKNGWNNKQHSPLVFASSVFPSSIDVWLCNDARFDWLLFACWIRPKLRYPSSLISLPLSLIFSNLPPVSVVPLACVLLSLIFEVSASVAGVVAVAVLTFESNDVCFLLFKSPNRRGLGDIERLCKFGEANKLLSLDWKINRRMWKKFKNLNEFQWNNT